MKDKKKYNKKYTTKDRVDMSKGGRVKAQVGGKFAKAPVDSKKTPTMSIEREEEVRPTVQPRTPVQPAVAPKDVPPVTGTKPVQPTPTFTQAPTTGKDSDQMFIGRTDEETRATQIQPSQAQTTVVDVKDSTAPMTREQFNRQYGDYEGPMRGSQAVKQRNSFNSRREKAYDEYIGGYYGGTGGYGGGYGGGTGSGTGNEDTLAPLSDFQSERKERIIETAQQAQQMAQGIMPENIPTIPDPKKIDRADTEISPEQAAELQMEATKQAEAAKVAAVSPEQVSIIEDVATAAAPEPFDIATIGAEEVAKVPEDAVVEAATGTISPEVSETLAKAAGVQAVAPIDAAEVEVLPGALQERVVGTISPEAKAQAAKVAGTTLARVTRAKKQLRNAGLSEEDITELGNDPEALEVRLTDFTEEQRGIVEGLPEEALVSNQIDSLLSGIEEGNIPPWAAPAVASVEAMLAQRGMSASTVGRDALLNAIITSALPIAQANAQAIQTSVSQQKSIEATAALKNAEMAQQTALFNAQNVFNMDMAQFSADQQREINNSKFLQTASLQNATMEQQGVMQDAILMSQRNLAEADQNTKLGIENARAFLAMDIQNLNNEQQASILKAQQIQQRLLSNQAAENAALQFNATSQNQVNQFMTSIKAQTDQFNATQNNAMEQFNANAKNAAEARRAGRDFEAARIDAQLATDIDKFNAAQDFAREQFNVQNETAIAQSNVQWRRQANTADTAAINAVNQQNAQNAFGLTASAQNFLWQELRDEADFIFRRWDNDQQRKASLMIAALGNEGATAKDTSWSSNLSAITQLVSNWLD